MTNIIPSIFFDGIDRTHVRSMRNRKLPFSGGLAGIAVATVSIFDEASGHFSPQIPVKIKRAGYIHGSTVEQYGIHTPAGGQ
ncbi:MAG TPA: hypothetical protein VKZ54_05315 [Membranihabitans sp.]|nr:hypothetical protein [Membranihabitans sp.]